MWSSLVDQFIPVFMALIVAVAVLVGVWLGFRMGRMTQRPEYELAPKHIKPGPVQQDQDPWADAMRDPEAVKRVPTLGGEE